MKIRPCRIARDVVLGGELPVLILGPCVIQETRHAVKLAKAIRKAAAGVGLPVVFKASFDKANRSGAGAARGLGLEAGLAALAAVKDATGLPVTTDVHETWQVEPAAKVVDLLQVPAFLCRQTDLVAACAASGRPTTIKKGQFLAPKDAGNIVAKFHAAGGRDLALIERGTSFGYNNLVVDFRSLPIMRGFGVPVVMDATHAVQSPGGMGDRSGGDGRFAPLLARAAMAVGCEGIFMETHDDPMSSPSDGPNMVPLAKLPQVLRDIRALHDLLGRPAPPA